ncbi:MAG: protein kinase [Phycisphaerales bacterium]|jgi:non-specific serine/threonine protein kinase/serine/threonine-protein kinase
MTSDEPTQHPDTPGSRPERDLIREAIEQATPREGGVNFADDMPPENAFPGYEIIREIHRGGQGVVYQAIQKTTRRKVAIKVLHGGPFSGAAGRTRFEREVQVLGQLNHPNIVRIHDSGVTTDGGFFYVMDYISGRTLDEVLSDKRPSVEETIVLFTKICDAVNAAHLKGVIHRDLKPANVRVDANGEPIVVDFGLAKISGPDAIDSGHKTPQLMTLTGQFIGSLPWASPEQAEGVPGNIDVRTDVYSLGVMLYQMLTGQFPYRVVGAMRDVLDNILRAQPAKPSTIRRQINDEVETIVLKCLSKERERRYQSAGELARDLRRYLAGEPVEAKRDSAGYVIGKTLEKYRPWVVAAGIVLVGLVGLSIAMTVLYRKALAAEEKTAVALSAAEVAKLDAQRQAARAQDNFLAGHELAMSMITDLQPAIEDLRGGTKARELLLLQAQKYLDRLKSEAGDDVGLLLDLAKAHEQVADLQGGLYFFPKTGQGASSEENLAKAKEIREALLARLPGDARVHAAIARTRTREGTALRGAQDLAGARTKFAAAIDEYDRALALGGADQSLASERPKWIENRAWVLGFLGDVLTALGNEVLVSASSDQSVAARELLGSAEDRYAAAREYWSTRLLHEPADADAARALGVIADQKASAVLARARALVNSAKMAMRINDQDAAKVRLGEALTKFAEAKQAADAGVEAFAQLTKSNNASGELRRDLWIALLSRGKAAAEQADASELLARFENADENHARSKAGHEEALAHYRQAEEIAQGLTGADGASLAARRDWSVCLVRVGDELRNLAQWEEATATYTKALTLRQETAQADPIQRHRLDLAIAYYKLGLTHTEAAKAAAAPAQAPLLASAEAELGRAMSAFQALRQEGGLADGNSYEREAGSQLEQVKQLRAKLP